MNLRLDRIFLRLLLASTAFTSVSAVKAEDVMIIHRREAHTNKVLHSDLVLEEAMRRTKAKYGSYRIERVSANLARERLMIEMIKGNQINTASVATQPSWEARMLPVWIPIDMGISSYRIGFVRRDGQAKLSAIKSEADLKKLKIGAGLGWSSRQVFEANGFEVETAADQEALTKMLLAGRLDYFPRGVNEVFAEFDNLEATNPELAIESDLVLEFPLPNYIYISPSAPHLAKRVTEGMESMIRDGTLLKLVKTYHADMLQRANLCSRRVLRIKNPLLSEGNPIGRKELWFDPYDKKTGICNQASNAAPRKAAGQKASVSKP